MTMDLVPAPAVRLMKRRVLSRPGVNRITISISYFKSLILWKEIQNMNYEKLFLTFGTRVYPMKGKRKIRRIITTTTGSKVNTRDE